MNEIAAYIIAAKAIVLAFGGLITYLAHQAFHRTDAAELRWFAVGFGVITLSALIGGVLNQLVSVSSAGGVLVTSLLSAAGFAVLAHALYAQAGAVDYSN